MNESRNELPALKVWINAITLGSLLLLLGHALPWPCIGSTSECTALITYHLSHSWYGLLIVIGIVLIPFEVSLLSAPFNYMVWSFFWFLLYLLFSARIYPVYMGMEIEAYLPMLDTNEYLPGPTRWVIPLSLIAFWLAVRPRSLQELWKFSAIVALVTLVIVTGAFYIFQELDTQQFLNTGYFRPTSYVFGSGPLVILAGAIILLSAEFFESMAARTKTKTGGGAPSWTANRSH